tara:strand:+ start:702 stop:1256 length:555 start_codon:yes stop_codon:yes gene_type:complete
MKKVYKLGDELMLRTFESSDADELYRVIDANREAIGEYMRWVDEVAGPDWATTHIEQWQQTQAETGVLFLAIVLCGELVGSVFHVRPDMKNNVVEVGYWLAESARGKGVATRALRKLLDVTFGELGFNRVNIRIAPGNKPSLAIAKRLGLEPEGVCRQAWKVGDEYWDAVEFGVLASEWETGGS